MKTKRFQINYFKYLPLVIISIYFFHSCDIPCYTIYDEPNYEDNIYHQIVINLSGTKVEKNIQIKLPTGYNYLEETSLLTSDNSFIKVFGKSEKSWNRQFRNNNDLYSNYQKTIYFDEAFDFNWNTLSKDLNFTPDMIMDVRSPYETCLIYSDSLVNLPNHFTSDTSSIQLNRGIIQQHNMDRENGTVLLKQFKSAFISSTTYLDTVLTDIKIKNDEESLVALKVSEFRLSNDSLSTQTKYALVKQEIVLSRLSNNGVLKTVFKQLNTSDNDKLNVKIRLHADYILLKSSEKDTDQFVLLDADYTIIEGDLFSSNDYTPVASQKGRSMILAKYSFFERDRSFLLRDEYGQKQNLGEFIKQRDETIDYATIYDNRYVVYLSNRNKILTLYDISTNTVRFSLNIYDDLFKKTSTSSTNYYQERIIPLIFIKDQQLQLMIEYSDYPIDPGC
jgi:hypothetical protein